jgi:P-type Cu+ transporter
LRCREGVDKKREEEGRVKMQGYIQDPVCGMQVNEEQTKFDKMIVEHKGETYHFCSAQCIERFREDPDHFINQRRSASAK